MAPPVIDYRASFHLDMPPTAVWLAAEHFELFERWWTWLSELTVQGTGLRAGTRLRGVIAPPVPYTMRIEVALIECRRPRAIDAEVRGDLVGPARLRFRRDPTGSIPAGTTAEVAWTLEMTQRSMRIASAVAHPLLCWGHDRVVEWTVAGFKRQAHQLALGSSGPADGTEPSH